MCVAPQCEILGVLEAFCKELPSGTPVAGRASGLPRRIEGEIPLSGMEGKDAGWGLRLSLVFFGRLLDPEGRMQACGRLTPKVFEKPSRVWGKTLEKIVQTFQCFFWNHFNDFCDVPAVFPGCPEPFWAILRMNYKFFLPGWCNIPNFAAFH